MSSDPRKETYQHALEVFESGADWVTFFRQVLGVHGFVRRRYRDEETLAKFEKTEEFAAIQQMLAQLRKRKGKLPEGDETTRVVTIRIPKSLHDWLRNEAFDRRTSMNKLCISKLLLTIDAELVPAEMTV